MRITVNGEAREVAAANLAEALRALDYADAVVATGLNSEFVPGRRRGMTSVPDGDRIEIVSSRRGWRSGGSMRTRSRLIGTHSALCYM